MRGISCICSCSSRFVCIRMKKDEGLKMVMLVVG